MRFVFYNEFTSILRQPLGLEHYTIGIKCSNDDEETFIEQLAASQVGNPNVNNGLIISGNMSEDHFCYLMGRFKDLTLHVNDAYLMPTNLKKDVWRMAHDNGNSNVMVGCGYDLLSYRTSDEDKARSICVNIPNFTDVDIDSTRDVICSNYGHVMEYFMKEFFKNKNLINDWYNESYENLLQNIPQSNPYRSSICRQADYLATSEVAGILLENVYQEIGFESLNPREVVNTIWKELLSNDWGICIN